MTLMMKDLKNSAHVEASEISEEEVAKQFFDKEIITESLIPRATVIDQNYQNLPDVKARQSILDRQMQKNREDKRDSSSESSILEKVKL